MTRTYDDEWHSFATVLQAHDDEEHLRLGDLGGPLNGLDFGGLDSLVTGLGGLGGLVPDPTTSSNIFTPYIDLFTQTFTNLEAIGAERIADPAPILEAILTNWEGYFQDFLANPASIVDIPGEMLGHLSNVFSALAEPATITTHGVLPTMVQIMLGMLPVLGLGALGPLVTTAEAFATVFGGLSSGDPATAITALIDAPATVTNGFLNGTVGLNVSLLGVSIPLLNGILVPDSYLNIPFDRILDITAGPFGGLTDGLVNYVPQQIAAALTDPTTGSTLTGLLSGLDPSTPLGDLGTLLPGDLSTLLSGGVVDLARLTGRRPGADPARDAPGPHSVSQQSR